jgi:hypothetical protein
MEKYKKILETYRKVTRYACIHEYFYICDDSLELTSPLFGLGCACTWYKLMSGKYNIE